MVICFSNISSRRTKGAISISSQPNSERQPQNPRSIDVSKPRITPMTQAPMNPQTKAMLEQVSVATLATALFKRGLRNQVIQDVRPVAPKGKNMVGPAFTLRYMPAREDRNQLIEFRNPKHPQRHAIETCPEGFVLVMDSRKNATAASAGDILITRLMMRGGAGVVTDGGFRDAMRIGELD